MSNIQGLSGLTYRPSSVPHTQAKYHQPHRSGGGCKPAYGTLGKENRRRLWSAEAGGLVAFRRRDDGGRTMWGIDTGGGRLNIQKRAERRQIGQKERGDGQYVTEGERSPDESWGVEFLSQSIG